MNSQSRNFAKQVQVDLLALGDVDLFRTVQQWVETRNLSRETFKVPEETRIALN